MTTTAAVAEEFAKMAIRNIRTEFPHHTSHVLRTAADPSLPRELHPAFHGAYDWHSCVHMHWLLVNILTDHPQQVDDTVVSALNKTLTESALREECDYLRANPHFERPYGWAWLYALAAACVTCPHPSAVAWATALRPLADTIEELVLDWLHKAAGPVRYGAHPNTAFALGVFLDSAHVLGRRRLAERCRHYAERWFATDRNYPAEWEPSGQDFLSPALCEADLLRRLFPQEEFTGWLGRFLPALAEHEPATLFTPAKVVDATDGYQGHLFGLNLSRAWQFRTLAAALPDDDPRVPALVSAADRHLAAGLPAVTGHGFVNEHWLASFAYLALAVAEW